MLKFIKVVITFLQFNEATSKELCELIITHVFSLKNSAKYTMIIRKILNKLIARVGVATVLACTAKGHQKLISYIERLRRKQKNAKARNRRFAETSGHSNTPVAVLDENKEMLGEDSDEGSSDEEGDEAMEMEEPRGGASDDEDDSGDSDDSDGDVADDGRGVDKLQIANGIDIPQGVNIPIVSQLAKEAYKRD